MHEILSFFWAQGRDCQAVTDIRELYLLIKQLCGSLLGEVYLGRMEGQNDLLETDWRGLGFRKNAPDIDIRDILHIANQ